MYFLAYIERKERKRFRKVYRKLLGIVTSTKLVKKTKVTQIQSEALILYKVQNEVVIHQKNVNLCRIR